MAIQTVGVIGAGQMGNGIAHVLSQSGYSVLLNDVNQDALDRAVERVRKKHGPTIAQRKDFTG